MSTLITTTPESALVPEVKGLPVAEMERPSVPEMKRPPMPEAKRLPASKGKRPPGPSRLSLFSNAYGIAHNMLGFAQDLWQRYGDVVRIPLPLGSATAFFHPEHVKQVLQEHHLSYDKSGPMFTAGKVIFGNGLFMNNGESWLHQRRLMQPSFHRQRIAAFGTLMSDATLAMMERWQNTHEPAQPLDMPLEMTRLSQRIGGLTLFDMDLSANLDTVGHAVADLLPLLSEYVMMPFPPIGVPTRRNLRIRAGVRTLDEVVYGIIAQRRADPTGVETNDLLSMLLWARDEETGEGMNDQQLRDEVMNLLIAGHETSTVALTWLWYVLAQYPEVENRLHAELDAVLGGRPPTVEQLANLPYTRMVVQETMRLYPPVFALSRHAITDDTVGGYHVSANSQVFLCPYYTHRHPEFWEQPEVFDPERFTPQRSANQHRFAYFPFGGGPRQCIGNSFALMEAQIVLATVAQRYSLRLVPGHVVEPQAMFIVQPRHGLPMTLHPR